MERKPAIGLMVNYVLPRGRVRVYRPAVITMVHGDTCVNLHVLEDANDGELSRSERLPTSVVYDDVDKTVGSWHWPQDHFATCP